MASEDPRPDPGSPSTHHDRHPSARLHRRVRCHDRRLRENPSFSRSDQRGDRTMTPHVGGLRRPRVAFVVQRYLPDVVGGAEYQCRLYAELLTASCDVTVLTTNSSDHTTWTGDLPVVRRRGVLHVPVPPDGDGVAARRRPGGAGADGEPWGRRSSWSATGCCSTFPGRWCTARRRSEAGCSRSPATRRPRRAVLLAGCLALVNPSAFDCYSIAATVLAGLVGRSAAGLTFRDAASFRN